MKSYIKVENWFLYIVIIFFFIGFFGFKNNTLDIQIHDTYIVTEYFQLFIFFSLFFGILGSIYLLIHKLAKKQTNKILGVFHFSLSIISSLGLLLPVYIIGSRIFKSPAEYYENSSKAFLDRISNINQIITSFLILLIIAQLIFLTNITLTLLKKTKTT